MYKFVGHIVIRYTTATQTRYVYPMHRAYTAWLTCQSCCIIHKSQKGTDIKRKKREKAVDL